MDSRDGSSINSSTTTISQCIDDRYDLKKPLGFGRFSRVYLAHDRKLCIDVALKLARTDNFANDKFASKKIMQMFLHEVQTIKRLQCQGVVQIHQIHKRREPPHEPYISMQYMPGGTLKSLISEHKEKGLSPSKSVAIALRIAHALVEIHKAKYTHKDVKPGNILLDDDGEAWLSDFGLALHDDDDEENSGISGTPEYMSPEQTLGETLDGRSDIWSLGVVLYEMLTGTLPFPRGKKDKHCNKLWSAIRAGKIRRPLQQFKVPQELDRIFQKCVCPQLDKRYLSASQLADELKAALRLLDGESKTTRLKSANRFRYAAQNEKITTSQLEAAFVLGGALWDLCYSTSPFGGDEIEAFVSAMKEAGFHAADVGDLAGRILCVFDEERNLLSRTTRTVNGEAKEYLVATIADAELANALASEVMGQSLDSLLPQTRQLLVLIDNYVNERAQSEKKPRSLIRFTQRKLREAFDWSDFQIRKHLSRLLELEYVLSYRTGAKNQREYELLYDGQGRNGEKFLLGLTDVKQLKAKKRSPQAG